ncbi:MAG: hypothetical protein Q7S74_03185 [Nanoarchaeota archaeon]|nr:hypothetical protein [Nanoarchaeota archaeon]
MNTLLLNINPMYSNNALASGMFGPLVALALTFLLIFVILMIAAYIYTSFALMAIARKAKVKPTGIAWIPVVGPAIIASKAAKMHWWPILLLIGSGIPIIGPALSLVFLVFFIIWMWKTFEKIGKDGWWAILLIIPIVNLIILGIAAWSKK